MNALPSSTSCESEASCGLASKSVASKLVGPDLAIEVRLKLLARALVDEVLNEAFDEFTVTVEDDDEVFKSPGSDDSHQC